LDVTQWYLYQKVTKSNYKIKKNMPENNKPKQSRKGKTNNPNGRPAGTPNKVTADARAAIAMFVEQNSSKLDLWLTAVADGDAANDIKPNPAKAFELFQSVIEYHVPKLSRAELTGKDGKDLEVKTRIELVAFDDSTDKTTS
jgi:hypothetical protein